MIEAFNKDGQLAHWFESQAAAGRAGFSRAAINLCLSGKRKSHRGLTWRRETGMGRLLAYVEQHTADAGERPVELGELVNRVRATLPVDRRDVLTVYVAADHLPYRMHSDSFHDATVNGRYWT